MTALELIRRAVREKYNSRSEIWPLNDIWHTHTAERLEEAVTRLTKRYELSGKTILNVGSAGRDYGLDCACHVHLDLAERHLSRERMALVGSAESLPFATASFDFILCVGSVLNYCDAVASLSEIARVLKPSGILLLEFESSSSAEYVFREQFGKSAVSVTTKFQGEAETLWLYSPSYISGLIRAVGLKTIHEEGFHVLTTLGFRLTRRERLAMAFSCGDRSRFVRGFFRSIACNRILLAEKAL